MPDNIVQIKSGTIVDPAVDVLTLDSPVTAGNILVAFCLLGVFVDGFIPSDTQGNTWVSAPQIPDQPWPSSAWYVLGAAAGTTSVSFSGFYGPYEDYSTWVLVLELSGCTDFDSFNMTVND